MILKATLFLILSLIVAISCHSNKQLRFNNSETFKIMQLTDLHYGDSPHKDTLNLALSSFLIKTGKPNFVAFSGDMVSGYAWDGTDTFYQRYWTKFTYPVIEQQILYGIANGNHDTQANYNSRQIVEHDMTSPLSLTLMSPENVTGGTNYYIPIYSQFNSSHVSAVIWFLDTHDHGCMGNSESYGCIDQSQQLWFEQQMQQLHNLYGNFTSLVFFHIPLPEYAIMFNTVPIYGHRGENVCCPIENSGFFEVLQKWGVRAVSVGHDHDNDYGGFYYNVELIYGRKTGFGSYGPHNIKDEFLERGARVFELKENNDNGLITVELSHHVLTADGIAKHNGPSYKRIDKIRKLCASAYQYDKYDDKAQRYDYEESEMDNEQF